MITNIGMRPTSEVWYSRLLSNEMRFEFIEASGVCSTSMPHGEIGVITGRSDGPVQVGFPSKCTLEVNLRPARTSMVVAEMRLVSCETDVPFIILLRLLLNNRLQPYFMIPAVLYGSNNAARGIICDHPLQHGYDPKLGYRSNQVNHERVMAPGWHVRADRSANPSTIAVFDRRCVAIGVREATEVFGGEWIYNSLGIWTSADDGDSISIAFGSLDWPGRFDKHQLISRPTVEPLRGRSAIGATTQFFLYEAPASNRFAYEGFVVQLATALHEAPRDGHSLKSAAKAIADALVNEGVNPESGYFYMFRDVQGIAPAATLLAYAGVLQIARPLVDCGMIFGEDQYLRFGLEMIDRAVSESSNGPHRLFCDAFVDGRWQPNTWWPALGYSSLINGDACYALLKLCDEQIGFNRWAEKAKRVLDHAIDHQRGDGRFPSGFSAANGQPTTYAGIAGSFFVAPLLIASRRWGLSGWRDAASKALKHYWDEFARLEWVGVELDCAGAVDSTSSYGLSRALVELHRQEPSEVTLQRLRHVLHYACTYHFAHNTRHRHSACDWSSCGAKVTSTHNLHIDAYAGFLLEDIAYYLSQSDEPYLRMRLEDAVAWARQAFNRTHGEYGWGKVGWTTEQFNHTYVSYYSAVGDGTVWNAYFPWVSGALLATFAVGARYSRTQKKEGQPWE